MNYHNIADATICAYFALKIIVAITRLLYKRKPGIAAGPSSRFMEQLAKEQHRQSLQTNKK